MREPVMDVTYALDEGDWAFEITSDAQAEEALLTVLKNNAESERLQRLALDMASKYTTQAQEVGREYERRNEWHMKALQTYFDRVDKHVTKTRQTYRLLSGTLVQKKQQPTYKYDSNDLLAWAQDNAPQYIKEVTKTSIDWAGLKKSITQNGDQAIYTETGEVLPITVRERPDVFMVEGGKN